MIPAGARGEITFEVSEATTKFIAHIVEKVSRRVVGRFAFPAKTGYTLLAKTGNNYSGVISADVTILAHEESLDIELKPFISDDLIPIGIAPIDRIQRNTLEGVE
jgi:hypothetical protein